MLDDSQTGSVCFCISLAHAAEQVTEEVTVGFLRRAWGLGSGNGGGNQVCDVEWWTVPWQCTHEWLNAELLPLTSWMQTELCDRCDVHWLSCFEGVSVTTNPIYLMKSLPCLVTYFYFTEWYSSWLKGPIRLQRWSALVLWSNDRWLVTVPVVLQ